MSNTISIQQRYASIVEQASVCQVISAYGLSLFKKGKSWKSLCPFHDDRHPSLSVRHDDKVWKCFTCGESGNAITFVQKYENQVLHNASFSIVDAMNKVIQICNLPIPQMKSVTDPKYQYIHNGRSYTESEQLLLKMMEKISQVSVYYIMQNKEALEYLKQRGMEEALIERMAFGILPRSQMEVWIQDGTFPLRDLEEAGLAYIDQDGNYQPAMFDRILIPIRDERGNIVSFSGRAIHNEDPKYLLGKTSPVFQKGHHLYHYEVAKRAAYDDAVYIVEGFFDVAAGKKMGMENIVATMGTSLSSEQKKLLKRLNCELVLMWDNDEAGKSATLKELPSLIRSGFDVSVIDLGIWGDPTIKDPWDAVQAGMDKKDLNNAKISGLHYLIMQQYLSEPHIDASKIKSAYDALIHDHLIKTTFDQMIYKECATSKTDFSRKEIDDILQATPIIRRQEIHIDAFMNMYRLFEEDPNKYVNISSKINLEKLMQDAVISQESNHDDFLDLVMNEL